MSKTLGEKIAAELETQILSGRYKNGEKIDEIKTAKKFGVSRTPFREALKVLAFTGLVNQIPNKGVFVKQPGPIELLEMFEVMSELEAICGKLAARRIDENALEALEQICLECEAAEKNGDPDEYYYKNELFHQIIYRESGNLFLEEQTLLLQKRLRPYRRMQLRYRGRMKQSLKEHQEIVDALSSSNAECAQSTLREHVSVQGDRFHQLVSSFSVKDN